MILYRPVGLKELELIAAAGFEAFPLRLPEQPIFYPVLNFEYAQQIARDWNTKGESCAGFVTRFEIDDAYAGRFEVHQVGQCGLHCELWVPAEELPEFNTHILGKITVETAYYGAGFGGQVDPETNLPTSIQVRTSVPGSEIKSCAHISKVLHSHRLDLILMEPPLLEALLGDDYRRAEQIGGFSIPDAFSIKKRTLVMRLRQIHDNPQSSPWLLRAIVVRQSRIMCGYINFHSTPGPKDLRDLAADGVELGYTIAEPFRRQGFAKEAAITLMKWAFEVHGQRCFILSISPTNTASLALACSLGFSQIGSRLDDEDGLELVFERRLDRWPDDWKKIVDG